MSVTGEEIEWVRTWPDSEAPSFRVGRLGGDLVAEWPGFASLRTDRAGNEIECRFIDPAIDPKVVDKFRRGQVGALVRHLRGELTFHGAAAAIGETSVILLGASGSGKSSTLAALCARTSARFLADDIAPLVERDGVDCVAPLETHHWLAGDAIDSLGLERLEMHGGKVPVPPASRATEPAELALVIQLEWGAEAEAPRVREVTGTSVFETLSLSTIRFVVDEPAVALHDFQKLSRLAARTPVFELRRPRTMQALVPCVNIIAELLAAQGAKRRKTSG